MVNNLQYSEALVSNGFSQGEIGIFSTYLNKEPANIRELILLEDEADLKESAVELAQTQAKTDAALEAVLRNCTDPRGLL